MFFIRPFVFQSNLFSCLIAERQNGRPHSHRAKKFLDPILGWFKSHVIRAKLKTLLNNNIQLRFYFLQIQAWSKKRTNFRPDQVFATSIEIVYST